MENADGPAESRSSARGRAADEYAIAGAFIFLFVVLALASPHFLTPLNLLNTVEAGAIYGIVAIALTVLLIVGEFDLSAGAVFVLAGIVAAKLHPFIGTAPALLAGVGAGLAVGLVNGAVVAWLGVNSFVATLAVSLMVVGGGTLITNGFQLYVADPAFAVLGNALFFGVPWFVWIFLALAVAVGFVLGWTRLGRWLYASGGNREAARALGIDTGALIVGAFAFSGLAAGVAGAILVSRTATAIAGNGLGDVLFPAVAAVVVGGTSIAGGRGAVWRTLLGIYFLEMIRNGFNLLGVSSWYQSIVQGAIILIAVVADARARRAP
jgi:ribose transport system permease protein